jgi:hypothetical protein
MPAPVPIQIRYGDDGLLGLAASQAGASGAFQRQKAMDMQLISQMLQNKVQASLQEDQQAHEDQLSNDAFAMQRAAQPPQQTYFSMADQASANDPGLAMKQMSLATAKAAGVEGPELAILEGAASNKHINAAYFETMTDEMKKRASTAAGKKRNVSEKQAYFNSLGNSMPPEELAKLKPLADSEDMDLAQFRTSVGQSQGQQIAAAKQAEMEQKAIVQMNISAMNDKINQAQGELKAMQREDVASQDKELDQRLRSNIGSGMSYDEARSEAEKALGGKGAVEPTVGEILSSGVRAMIPGVESVSPSYKERATAAMRGDPMGLRRKIDMKQKQSQIDALQKQRDELIASVGLPAMRTAGTPAPDPLGIR